MSVFSLLLAFGCAVGLVMVGLRSPARLSLRAVDQGLLALAGALVGGRLGYVAFNWGYFASHAGEIWQVWLGGISGAGTATGFALGVCLAALWSREHLGVLADRLLPLGMALGVSAWLAAWWEGSAYGAQSSAWFSLPALDERGLWSERLPIQLLGALFSLALWAGLDWLQRRKQAMPGRMSALAWLGSCLLLFGLSFLRADPTPLWRGWRLDAWAWLSLAVLGGLGWAVLELRMAAQRRRNGL
jgi:phosphatidylglycerol:prolipoprotein diacylglycerol transferase